MLIIYIPERLIPTKGDRINRNKDKYNYEFINLFFNPAEYRL